MRQVASAVRARLSRLMPAVPPLVPPLEFPCRIEALPDGCADIDNDMYGDSELARSWHASDKTRELATLHLLNAARIPYFDRIWTQQLGLSPDRPGAFLEIGCGGGVATCALASRGYTMTGVDPAEASLEQAREHARGIGVQGRVRFAPGSAYDLSCFPPESFDGVVMADVLEHLYDLPAAVEQVWRCLRPGGVLVFDTINRTYASYVLAIALAQESLAAVPPRTHDWRLFIKPHELSFLLQSHGFLVDATQFRGLMPTLATDPRALIAQLARTGRPPPWPPSVPLSDFVEVSSLEVQYMGWAVKQAVPSGKAWQGMQEVRQMAPTEPAGMERRFAPGDLEKGLRSFRR